MHYNKKKAENIDKTYAPLQNLCFFYFSAHFSFDEKSGLEQPILEKLQMMSICITYSCMFNATYFMCNLQSIRYSTKESESSCEV